MASPFKKKKFSSCNFIPDDIVFSILSKLPIKSLKRFSCVRKSWSTLFQNPNFFDMFSNNLLTKSHSLYGDDDDDDASLILYQYLGSSYWNFYLLSGDKFQNKVKLDSPPPFDIPYANGVTVIRILGSAINGILCLYHYYDHNNVVLWNPASQEVKPIPLSITTSKSQPRVSYEFTLNGFGYDHVNDDYKVIQHVTCHRYNESFGFNDPPYLEIFSLKTKSWRKTNFRIPTRSDLSDANVYLDGVCHWWSDRNDKTYLVSFNLCNDEYYITPAPLEDLDHNFEARLTVLNGFVAMIPYYKKTMSFQISILGELGVKQSWVTLFDIDEMFFCVEYPIGAGKKGNMFFKNDDDEIACLDLTTGVIEEIGLKGKRYWSQMMIYKKNLHPIGGINN